MVLEFQLALGSVVNLLAFGMGSTRILGDCLGGIFFVFNKFVLWSFFSPWPKKLSIILVPLNNGCEP